MTREQRFLMYRTTIKGGHGYGYMHNLANLMALCTEGAHLGRSVILTPPEFDPAHNFGIPVNKDWDEYIDTKNIIACRISAGEGNNIAITAFTEDEIPTHSFSSADVGVVFNTENSDDPKVRDKPLLIRELTVEYNLWGTATPEIQSLYFVKINPSEKVRQLASAVTATLQSYIALHVRRGDRLKQNPLIDKYTQAKYIRDFIINRYKLEFKDIFLMSDERKPGFFQALSKQFSLHSYIDYPGLLDLVDSSRPDNYLLFCAEKLIYYKASARIGVFNDSDSIDYALSPYSMHYVHKSQLKKVRTLLASLPTKIAKGHFRNIKKAIRKTGYF